MFDTCPERPGEYFNHTAESLLVNLDCVCTCMATLPHLTS